MNTNTINSKPSEWLKANLSAYVSYMKLRELTQASIRSYTANLERFMEWLKSNPELDNGKVLPCHTLEYSNYLKEKEGLKNSSIIQEQSTIASFFRWAIASKLYEGDNPMLNIYRPKTAKPQYDLLTEEEIQKLLTFDATNMRKDAIHYKTITILLLETGLRVTEFIELKLRDVDFITEKIHVVKGKGNKERWTTFPKQAQHELLKWLLETSNRFDVFDGQHFYMKKDKDKPDEDYANLVKVPDDTYLFVNRANQPYNRSQVTNGVENHVYRVTGHKGITAHDLRHAYASFLLTNKVGLDQIQQLLGHSSYTTTLIYASHLKPETVPTSINELFANVAQGEQKQGVNA